MKRHILIWGYLSSFILLLGAIFLNHNFILGKILYLTGFFAFNIGYLIPLFWVIFQQNQENKIGLVLVFGILGFITFLTGVSFFVVNWGGGIILIYVGAGILILAILSIIALFRRFYETHMDSWFPVLIFGVFIVGSLLIGMVHRHVMRAFTIQNIESAELFNDLWTQNRLTATQIKNFNEGNLSNTDSINLVAIEEQTQHLINYIDSLKISLIKRVQGDAYKLFDGKTLTNLVPVQSNVEINTIHRFMLNKSTGKAYELKEQLLVYRKVLIEKIPVSDTILLNFVVSQLNTESHPIAKSWHNKSWEYQQYYNLPLISVLSQLSFLQTKIAVVEREIINCYGKQCRYHKVDTSFVIKNTVIIPNSK